MVDFMGMMKKATELQSKMQAMQAELEAVEVEGVSGGGVVKVTLSGQGRSEMRRRSTIRCSSRTRRKFSRTCWSPAHADARKKSRKRDGREDEGL